MKYIKRNFEGKWITSHEFSELKPINVYHRQCDTSEIETSKYRNKHILFRKKFNIQAVTKTELYISADDYYKLYINGRFVTQGPAAGYNYHYYYNQLDITDFLKEGENVIAVHTYYQGLINRVWVSGDNRHGLIMDVVSEGKTIVKSDESFLYAYHSGFSDIDTIAYQTQFMERYDSNSLETGFEKSDFDDSKWKNAAIRKYLDYNLYKQKLKQLEIYPVSPVEITKTENGYIADFGSEYVAYVFAKARGIKNSAVRIFCGQELNDDGSVRYEMRCNCRYAEEWILSGREDSLNQFDYKAFRYVEFILPDGCDMDVDSLCIFARHYPFELKAVPNVRKSEYLKIWDLCVNTIRLGVQEGVQDCPDREKGHYSGDGCYSAFTHLLLTHDTTIIEYLLDEVLLSSYIDKGLMACASCSLMQEMAEYPLMLPWLAAAHYFITKDKDYLEGIYDYLYNMMLYYKTSYMNNIGLLADVDKWCVVEWPAEYRDGYDVDVDLAGEGRNNKVPDCHNVINAYYIGAVRAMNKLADILGREPVDDVKNLKDRFINAFYKRDKKLFKDSLDSEHISFPGNVFALTFDLCPDKETENRIIEMIKEKRLSSSMFFVTFPVFMGLIRTKHRELVMDLIKDKGAWQRMINEGATTTFEGWGKDTKWNTSLFHLTLSYSIVFMTDWGIDEFIEWFD